MRVSNSGSSRRGDGMMEATSKKEKYVGQAMERVEDEALLRGIEHYADDYATRVDTHHAAILRSPVAHARINALDTIVSIDTSAALAQPGVVAVITGEDIKKFSDPFLNVIKVPGMNLWSLATDRVRYVGEAIACIVAKDRYLAEDAERARLWELGKGVNPAWARYQTTTVRTLPVVVLSPLQS